MNNMTKHSGDLPFRKMHGLGNDFVVVDTRHGPDLINEKTAKAIGNRYFGVGFDQLVVLRESEVADLDVEFWNSDGSRANACGNASRCIGQIIMDETGKSDVTFRTGHAILTASDAGDGLVSVNMGLPQLDWESVPLAHAVEDLTNLPLDGAPGAVGMGNPHLVHVVDDVESVDLRAIGPGLERHPLYPERTNVEFIQILDRETIRMRVWERGGEITLACGSGACAVAVIAHLKGLTERKVTVHLDGGPLVLDWRDDGVWMTGPTAHVFDGVISAAFLDGV
ncbi:diaminopimelate epimerase [Cochlodiniinecator piscidefendens]|uniref:diaminopimelate epimerase n=1 Tax=Cochlodiniinecator piscidefendens TaxID=2715756 RepID=UPI00140B32C8|nr:diaminopimelate epimerase [Cochlodiniinecator piscidefendens]